MAGGMDLGLGGRGKRKPVDTAINLVPFIDLMAVTISFLIMTAVWTQLSRLQVSQSGGPPSEPLQETNALDLTVTVTERGFSIAAERAPFADIPKIAGRYDLKALEEKLATLHAHYPDQHRVTVQVEDKVKYLDLIQVIDACVGSKLDAVSVSGAG